MNNPNANAPSSQAGLASFARGYGKSWTDTTPHQPRERPVPCSSCRRDTLEVHAVCGLCGPATCSRCRFVL